MFIRLILFLSLGLFLQAELRPQAITFADSKVFIAGEMGRVVSLQSGQIDKSIDLQESVIQLRTFGDRLYALKQGEQGALVTLNPNSLEEDSRLKLKYYPTDFQIKDDKVYIAYRFLDLLEARDLKNGELIWSQSLEREPTALSIVNDQVWVVTHLPHQASIAQHVSARVASLNINNGEVLKVIDLADGANGVRSLIRSDNGRYLYTTFVLARHRITTNQIARGWINTNALALIDTEKGVQTTVLLDDVDQGAPNPWGLAYNKGQIAVALAGSNELMIIDEAKLIQKLAETNFSKRKLTYKLSFLYDCSQKFKTHVRGLRAVSAGEKRWHFTGFFDHDYQGLSYEGKLTRPVNLSKEQRTLVRQGEEIFHSAKHSFQFWQSCSSCHPDTRADALNWDLLNDGIGTFRNTKNMLFAHFTPPTTITGCRANAYVSVRAGFKHIQFVEAKDYMGKAVDAYLKSMKPQASPKLVNGELSEGAKRGEKIFKEEAGCVDCHKGQYLTNMKLRNVGTGLGKEKGRKFDVPTLREVWRTRPYLHDGRARTMKEVLTKFNQEDKHGETSHLTEQDLNDLVEYVLSL